MYKQIIKCCWNLVTSLVPGILGIEGLNKSKTWDSSKYIMHFRFHQNIHFLLVIQEGDDLHIETLKLRISSKRTQNFRNQITINLEINSDTNFSKIFSNIETDKYTHTFVYIYAIEYLIA